MIKISYIVIVFQPLVGSTVTLHKTKSKPICRVMHLEKYYKSKLPVPTVSLTISLRFIKKKNGLKFFKIKSNFLSNQIKFKTFFTYLWHILQFYIYFYHQFNCFYNLKFNNDIRSIVDKFYCHKKL